MSECSSFGKVDRGWLANPEQGRAYLKAALKQNDEREFLSALHAIMDSLVDSEFNTNSEASVLPAWENAKIA